MPIPGFGNDGNMTIDLARFDLAGEIADAAAQKPWPSGIHSRTLFKKPDFRLVLISMEASARMKEHQVAATTSVQVLKGKVRYSAQGQTYDLQTGNLIAAGASIKHEVEAMEESVFLLSIAAPAHPTVP